jgi:hypothetical protein
MARMYLYSTFTYTPVRPLLLQASVVSLHGNKKHFQTPSVQCSRTVCVDYVHVPQGPGTIALIPILQLVRPTCSPIRATALEPRCIPRWLTVTRREGKEASRMRRPVARMHG